MKYDHSWQEDTQGFGMKHISDGTTSLKPMDHISPVLLGWVPTMGEGHQTPTAAPGDRAATAKSQVTQKDWNSVSHPLRLMKYSQTLLSFHLEAQKKHLL